ncbi:MAG: hypothetical protein NC180_05115 [Muribaculaceae bacterium]|nr:hypothetical protein [Muribaculaceae bacterium]
MKKENSFTPEQMSDVEQLLNELERVSENKRPFVVTVITAYMNGIEAGSAYTQTRQCNPT